MEKQLGTVAYWIGVVCTVVAVITRLLTGIRFANRSGPAGLMSLQST